MPIKNDANAQRAAARLAALLVDTAPREASGVTNIPADDTLTFRMHNMLRRLLGLAALGTPK